LWKKTQKEQKKKTKNKIIRPRSRLEKGSHPLNKRAKRNRDLVVLNLAKASEKREKKRNPVGTDQGLT